MIDEQFSENERNLLLHLVLHEAQSGVDELLINLIAKLAGTETVLIARRAYPAPQVEMARDAGG